MQDEIKEEGLETREEEKKKLKGLEEIEIEQSRKQDVEAQFLEEEENRLKNLEEIKMYEDECPTILEQFPAIDDSYYQKCQECGTINHQSALICYHCRRHKKGYFKCRYCT